MSAESHSRHYIKIWAILVVLLVISVIGPMFGHKWLTLITAFGIACVKAYLVARHFMHLDIEKAMIRWVLITSVVLMGLFYTGTAPDVMEHSGLHWTNDAAIHAAENPVHEPGDHHAAGAGEGEAGHAAGGPGGDAHVGGDAHGAPAGAEEAPAAEAGSGSAQGGDAEGAAVPAPGGEVAEAAPASAGAAPGFDAAAAYQSSCSTCHGEAGDGNGPVGAALNPKPANFTAPAFWEARDDAMVHKAIKEGGAAVGKSPMMAPWGSTYDDAQIDAIIAYLHHFNSAGGAAAEAAGETP